jgi:hypothetical protein
MELPNLYNSRIILGDTLKIDSTEYARRVQILMPYFYKDFKKNIDDIYEQFVVLGKHKLYVSRSMAGEWLVFPYRYICDKATELKMTFVHVKATDLIQGCGEEVNDPRVVDMFLAIILPPSLNGDL